ncbi:MAG: hypothetical protein QM666_05565 [Acinetobacter sp.]
MKRILQLTIPVILMVGCGQSKQLTPQEAWHNFCTVIPSAAYNIMTDRQQGIKKEDAVAHAAKMQDPKGRAYLESLIEEAYTVPVYQQLEQQQKAMEDFKNGRYESCMKAGSS